MSEFELTDTQFDVDTFDVDIVDEKLDYTHYQETKRKHSFYKVQKNGNGDFKGIRLIKSRFIDILKENNIFRYDIDNSEQFVLIEDNKVKSISIKEITDFFEDYINKLDPIDYHFNIREEEGIRKKKVTITPEMIRELLFERLDNFFAKSLLLRCKPDKKIDIQTDTKQAKYLYFSNTVVEISKTGYKLLPYQNITQFIWNDQIIQHEFQYTEKQGMFETFVNHICNGDSVRIRSLMTVTGYLLHGFFDTKLYAVILTDSTISEEDEANGRSGKTLYMKSLGKVLNTDAKSKIYVEINGRNFKPSYDFKYEACGIETRLVALNDITRNFNIESLFNDITEGIDVNQKNQKPFKIYSKIGITTNRTIKIEGESAKDRVINFEFSNYYNSNRSPHTEFGVWFFSSDWNVDDWNQFYSFMVRSCIEYFKHGIIQPPSISLPLRTLRDYTSKEFILWITDFFADMKYYLKDDNGNIETVTWQWNEIIHKKDLYSSFVKGFPDYDNKVFKQRTFTIWLKKYISYNNEKNTEKILQLCHENETEYRSNGQDVIILVRYDKNNPNHQNAKL